MENEPMNQDLEQNTPIHESIAALAYALWQERGCPDGSAEEDWFRAEQEWKAGRS